MPSFIVNFKEICYYRIVVEADSEDEAEDMIERRFADTSSAIEYTTLDPTRIVTDVERLEENDDDEYSF